MFLEFNLKFAEIFISEHEAAMAEAAEKAPSLSRHRSCNVSAVGNNARALRDIEASAASRAPLMPYYVEVSQKALINVRPF
jgi:hypothetical protein